MASQPLVICLYLSIFLLISVNSDCSFNDCNSCASAGGDCGWCVNESKCSTQNGCKTPFFLQNDAYECPREPDPSHLFTDSFGRDTILPMVAAAYASNPDKCLRNKLKTASFYKDVYVPCDTYNKSDFCYAYTGFDMSRKVVIIGFRGTSGDFETVAEVLGVLKKKDNFLGIGQVYDYFNNGFFYLWNGGLKDQVMTLRKVYPTFDVYIVGHSLGGSLASLCAAYLVHEKMWTGDKMKLVTFGQPRTGDVDYAEWHDANIPFGYRIVHRYDPIPHIPPKLDRLTHHRFEVWYDNEMTLGSNSTICKFADLGGTCANSHLMWQFDDHLHYFNTAVSTWGNQGCP